MVKIISAASDIYTDVTTPAPSISHSWPHRIAAVLRTWHHRHRQRAALALIIDEPERLADMGLIRQHAIAEAAKPFWQA